MIFRSILFKRIEDRHKQETLKEPVLTDLNLNQIIDAITAGKEEYDLKPFFYTSLNDLAAIQYRLDIMRELESQSLLRCIKSFADKIRQMRAHLQQSVKLYYHYQKEAWFLDAVEIYCEAVNGLLTDLKSEDLQSAGFLAFRMYVDSYAHSEQFLSLLRETKTITEELSQVKYCVNIKGNFVKVRRYESETDYSAEVEDVFKKFKQGAAKDYRVSFPNYQNMNHVEAKILELVARIYPEVFSSLDDYCDKNKNYLDDTVGVFDREIQFYVAYLDYAAVFKKTGLNFCYPQVSDQCKEVFNSDGFDLALAYKLIAQKSSVVCNGFSLQGLERIIVVSGPNQGGKTTFARTFGQIHYLASLGCAVPGTEARLYLFDRLFTHFEKEEDITSLHGKLQDDLVRIQGILSQATSNSIIIINEIFNSTTLQDAIFLSKKVMAKISEGDLLCICVTFIDELASLNEKTVSMMSTVVPENPAQRTYKIVRKPADGLSYAISIAQKYRLTYDLLKERLKS